MEKHVFFFLKHPSKALVEITAEGQELRLDLEKNE